MAEDPFDDFGAPPKRSAAERFEKEDRVNPERDAPQRRPVVPRQSNRYAWVAGIVMLMLIVVVLLTTAIPNRGVGVKGPTVGQPLPAFAAPLATSDFGDDSDANVFDTAKAAKSAGKQQPACALRARGILNSCDLRKGHPSVLTLIVTQGADCEPQIDRVERMRRAFPAVSFAAVMSGQKRSEAEKIVRRRGWKLPVGVDKDGAVTNLYGVGVCPTTIFSDARGRVRRVDLGNLTEGQLRNRVRALLARR